MVENEIEERIDLMKIFLKANIKMNYLIYIFPLVLRVLTLSSYLSSYVSSFKYTFQNVMPAATAIAAPNAFPMLTLLPSFYSSSSE